MKLSLSDRISAIEKIALSQKMQLMEMKSDPMLLLWKNIDIEKNKDIFYLLTNETNRDYQIFEEFILDLKHAQHSFFQEKGQGLEQLIKSIEQIKSNLDGVYEIPRRIEFIEDDCKVMSDKIDQLSEQKELLETVLEAIQNPTSKKLLRLIKNTSTFSEKKQIDRAFKIINLLTQNRVDETDGLSTVIERVRQIESYFHDYSSDNSPEFLLFFKILQSRYHEIVKEKIQVVLTSLENIKESNEFVVQSFQEEKDKLRDECSKKNIEGVCQEINARVDHFKKFMLEVASESDLIEQLKIADKIIEDFRQVRRNFIEMEEKYKDHLLDQNLSFELSPNQFSVKAYHRYLGKIKKYFIIPINYLRKLMGHRILERDTIKDFIFDNYNYSPDETPMQLKKRVNVFVKKQNLPDAMGEFIGKSFLEYIQCITDYISQYREEYGKPSIEIYFKRLDNNLEAIQKG